MPPDLNFKRHSTGQAVLIAGFCALLGVGLGCQSRAHQDLYRQKMASEIRVLEDQLYDADYQNRVLRDKIEQLKLREQDSQTSDSTLPARPLQRLFPRSSETPSTSEPDNTTELDIPEQEPPQIPEPPGILELELPEIIPGEIMPPPADGNQDELPPGRVPLPTPPTESSSSIPTGLRIHPGLSGAHVFDDATESPGLYLVVNAIDTLGKTVDITRFDIEGELSVVVEDPTRDENSPRLGRWDFSGKQLNELVRGAPAIGFHLPLQWQELAPGGNMVTVHVRLRSEGEEMTCSRNLPIGSAINLAKWLPRGSD